MRNKRWLVAPLASLLVSFGVALLSVHFASWFDRLTPTQLFFVVFGALAVISFGLERFYRREFAQERISGAHLDGLKATAQLIFDGVSKKQPTVNVNGKDCRDLFAHSRKIERGSKHWDTAVMEWSQAVRSYER